MENLSNPLTFTCNRTLYNRQSIKSNRVDKFSLTNLPELKDNKLVSENHVPYQGRIVFTGNHSMALYKFRLGIMLALKKFGFDVYAIAPPDLYSKKIIEKGITFIPIKMSLHETNPIKDIAYFYNLFKIYKTINPLLIFHYTIKPNIYGTLASRLQGISSYSIVPGRGHAFHKKNWLFKLVKKFYSFSLKHSLETWFLNDEDRDFFVKNKLVNPNKILVIPGEGVDTNYYTSSVTGLPNSAEESAFLFSGRLLWEKGVGVFADAARLVKKHYPATKFFLLGFLDKLDRRVVSANIVEEWVNEGIIEYLGEVEDVRPYIQKTDCFVLPSFYGEGLPRSLMEAASMERPLITTDHIGCRRAVLPDINGFICHPKDAIDLSDKMMAFIQLPHDRKLEMGKRSRKLMKEYFEEKLIIDIYLKKIGDYLNLDLLSHSQFAKQCNTIA